MEQYLISKIDENNHFICYTAEGGMYISDSYNKGLLIIENFESAKFIADTNSKDGLMFKVVPLKSIK